MHVSNSNSDEDELSSSSPPPPHLPPLPLPPSSTPLAATPGLGRSTPGSGGKPQVKPENAEHENIIHHRSGGGGGSNRGSNGRSNKKPRSKENNVLTEDEIIDEEEEGRTKSNSATTMSTNAGGNNGLRNNNSDGGNNAGGGGLNPAFASLLNCSNLDPNRPLSPGLQSHQINNNHLTQTDVPNTLEMLQKRTQEVGVSLFLSFSLCIPYRYPSLPASQPMSTINNERDARKLVSNSINNEQSIPMSPVLFGVNQSGKWGERKRERKQTQ